MDDRTDAARAAVGDAQWNAETDRLRDEVLPQLTRAVQAMRRTDFGVALPQVPPAGDRELALLSQELQTLASWLDLRFRQFAGLMRVSEAVAHGLFVDEVLDRVFETFRPLIPYNRIGCALLSEDQRLLTAEWTRTDYPQPKLKRGFVGEMARSSLQAVLKSRQPRILNDLQEYLASHPGSVSTRLIVAEGVRSSLTCPLLVHDRPIGFVFFSSFAPDTYRDLHQDVFMQIAAQLSALIERSRLYQKVVDLNEQLVRAHRSLREQSMHDTLTGALNRGAICAMLQTELQRAERKSHPPGVLMVDIDFFKQVNDVHGHLAGDAVLREVAQTMGRQLRAYDRLGRYGGEEFLIVLPEIDREGLTHAAERIRAAVADTAIAVGAQSLRVTVSIGGALCDSPERQLPDALLKCADDALYEAKHRGRNRICIEGAEPGETVI